MMLHDRMDQHFKNINLHLNDIKNFHVYLFDWSYD